jgi:hypothetical protein
MIKTKIMLAVIATFFITWCVMGLIGYLLSDLSYKECMTNGATLMFLLIFGWIPSVIVSYDMNEKFDNN